MPSTVEQRINKLENMIRVLLSRATGSGAVSSVFGRTGAVVAASADYTFSQVTNAYGVGGTDVAIADGGTAASTAAAAKTNLGTINFSLYSGFTGNYSPADATVYYWTVGGVAPQTSTGTVFTQVYVPMAGTLKNLTLVYLVGGTLGSGESVVLTLFKNSSTTGITVTVLFNSASMQYIADTTNTVAVAAGDIIELRQAATTWATNPTNVRGTWTFQVAD